MRKFGFAPVHNGQTRLLVLGSMPGELSLAAREYYAHPRNQFWELIGTVIQRDLRNTPYDQRLDALLGSGVGLWDVIGSAVRSGSLDNAIRSPQPAPLAGLLAQLPRLKAVAFNGRKAATLGRRNLSNCAVPLVDLPSSSPAYAAMSLVQKHEHWQKLVTYLA